MDESFSFGNFDVGVVVTAPPWYQNCYLVRHRPSGAQVIVDPGGDAERILAAAEAAGGGVAAIWLTHGHPDHIGAADAVQRALGVPCLAHADERPVIEGAERIAASLMGVRVQAPGACDYFEGTPSLALGGVPVRVVHTPGHTPGGVCYVFPGFALTGDTLFNHGVGRTDLPGGDGPALVASITRFLEDVPGETTLFSGHGPAWTAAEAAEWWRRVAMP